MNRTELIGRVSEGTGLARRDVETALEHTLHAITSAVKGGDAVRLTGFGTFRARDRAARMGRNPQTGAAVRIKASKHIAFSPGATLKSQLNSRGALAKPSSSASSGTAKKAAPAKSTAKRSTAKKSTAKKSTAKKSAAKKSTATKSTAKKIAKKATTAKKAVAKKATAKKSTAKKAPARKTASKATARKTAKKAPAKRR